MSSAEGNEKGASDINRDQRIQGIIRLGGLLLVLMIIWYGFDLAENL